jgi:hypothetical protein
VSDKPLELVQRPHFDWPVDKTTTPLLRCEIEPYRDPEDHPGVVLGVFTTGGALFCSLNPTQARKIASLLISAASPDVLVPPRLIVPQ